jgi:DNA-binding NtrC family response regulator
MEKIKILIVDDEQDFREVLSERLGARGIEVEDVSSGQNALEKVRESEYDAIILDLAMPEMDGIETLEKILQIRPSSQVIMLTGHASIQKGVEAVKKGAADFIEKPAELEELLKKIELAHSKKMEIFEQELKKKISDITKKRGW